MSNLPNWAVGLLFLAVIVFLGIIHMGPTLKPAVIDAAQLAAQGQEIEEGFYATPIAHTRTGEVR